MRRLTFWILPVVVAAGCIFSGPAQITPTAARSRLEAMADSALQFCRAKGMNTDFCVLVDMKAHPGRKRLHVWDFKAESNGEGTPQVPGAVTLSSLCCHGAGGGSTTTQPEFSNTPGSNCTSLGRYRIGARAWSNWGIHIHYKLHGLEATNSNAFKRIVVLHSFDPVPDNEIYPFTPPMGWSLGCPVVSNAAMTALDERLQTAAKPVLMWIYY